MGRDICAWLSDRLLHHTQNVQAAFPCLLECFCHDLRIDAADLDVHLQGCNAFLGSGDFEVHIAVVIFGAGDVS